MAATFRPLPFDQGDTMNEFVALASATGDTANLQAWIKGNIIQLLLLLLPSCSSYSPSAVTIRRRCASSPG